jgi:hypothetical protein
LVSANSTTKNNVICRIPLPVIGSSSELFGAQQGVQQVHTESRGNQKRQNIFHGMLLKAIAALHERPSGGEEQNRNQHEKYVQHLFPYAM